MEAHRNQRNTASRKCGKLNFTINNNAQHRYNISCIGPAMPKLHQARREIIMRSDIVDNINAQAAQICINISAESRGNN